MGNSVEYLVGEREYNGYHDSDFYSLYWSPEKGFREEMVGSTRFSSPHYSDPKLHPALPESMKAEMKEAMAKAVLPIIKVKASMAVLEPNSVDRGAEVMALAAGKFKDKRSGKEVSWAEGDVGKVFWVGYFGKFYRNGYNKPGRSNCRVGVEFPNGRVFVGLSKLRLAEEVPSDEDLMPRARSMAERPVSAYAYY